MAVTREMLLQRISSLRALAMLEAVRRKSRALPLAVLAILIALNACLIALLLRPQLHVTAEPAGQGAVSTPATQPAVASPAKEASPSDTANPSASSVPSNDPAVIPTRLLFASSASRAWRATVGDCQTPGRVERSSNGGKSWRLAVKPALGPIVRLGGELNGNFYTLGGAGKDCSIRYISYSGEGAIVAQTNQPRGIWFRDPKDVDQIQGPGPARAAPCNGQHVVGLASLSTFQALLVCTGGSVMVTSDSGKSWKVADELVGAIAVGAGGDRFWVASKSESCDGIAIRSFLLTAEKLSRGSSNCAADLPVTPGLTAIDVSGNAIWLWAGDEVQVSTDSGRTWS